MTSGAPLAQAFKTFRTRDIEGLSVGSYLLLLCMGSFTILIGVQYKIIAMILLNSLGLIAYLAIMSLLSRLVLFSFLARSEERRLGKGGVMTGRSGWWPFP